MIELIKLVIAILVLVFGIPIGNRLAKATKDESGQGQRWFKLIVLLSMVGVLIGLIAGNDVLLFSFAFIAIVTSRSLRRKK
ncbi:MAG TPA: hypothetical protein VJ142_00890 [Candidatus Nanoarchaeia archaeon]|nr:hypothetical protein [Candidatus Nanoarchaeia archaeon]